MKWLHAAGAKEAGLCGAAQRLRLPHAGHRQQEETTALLRHAAAQRGILMNLYLFLIRISLCFKCLYFFVNI